MNATHYLYQAMKSELLYRILLASAVYCNVPSLFLHAYKNGTKRQITSVKFSLEMSTCLISKAT